MVSSPRPSHPLRGALSFYDFLLSSSTRQTKQLFLIHYHRQKWPAPGQAVADGSTSGIFQRVAPVITAQLRERTRDPDSSAEPELHVNPSLQQQRRDILASHIFSDKTASALSRLLLFDYVLLTTEAWNRIWLEEVPWPQNGGAGVASLLHSLQFPLPIPAVFLQSATATPEVLGLALLYFMAAGCCSAAVWEACNSAEVCIDEVLECLQLTEEDVLACLQVLMLPGVD